MEKTLRKLAFLITIGMVLYLPWSHGGSQTDVGDSYGYIWIFDVDREIGSVDWMKLARQFVVTWALALLIPLGVRRMGHPLRKAAFLITLGMVLLLPWRVPHDDGADSRSAADARYDYIWAFDIDRKPGEVNWSKLAKQIGATWALALLIPFGLRRFDR